MEHNSDYLCIYKKGYTMINIENNAVNQELIMSIVKSSDILALDLSVRSHNALKRAFINTIGELCNATQLDLLRSKYMSIPPSVSKSNRKEKTISRSSEACRLSSSCCTVMPS